jgi:UDP-N-acetylmuramate--alanine ligase
MLTYGVQGRPDYLANFVSVTEVHPSYNLLRVGLEMGSIRLKVPGEHNVLNSLAAAAVAAHLGVDMSSIQSALLDFKGAERRFEVVYDNDGIMVVDDYAHHPAEIKATLSGAKSGYQKRVLAIFQPHLYSRTEWMLDEFASALALADEVIVIPAYAAREKPEDGVDGDSIVAKMLEDGYEAVEYVADKSELAGIVRKKLKEGTMALFMGAGDIGLISRELAADLSGGACC